MSEIAHPKSQMIVSKVQVVGFVLVNMTELFQKRSTAILKDGSPIELNNVYMPLPSNFDAQRIKSLSGYPLSTFPFTQLTFLDGRTSRPGRFFYFAFASGWKVLIGVEIDGGAMNIAVDHEVFLYFMENQFDLISLQQYNDQVKAAKLADKNRGIHGVISMSNVLSVISQASAGGVN